MNPLFTQSLFTAPLSIDIVDANEINEKIVGNINTLSNSVKEIKDDVRIKFYDATDDYANYKNVLNATEASENGIVYFIKHHSDFYEMYKDIDMSAISAVNKINRIFAEIEENPENTQDSDKYWRNTTFSDNDDRYVILSNWYVSRGSGTITEDFHIQINSINQFVQFFNDLNDNFFDSNHYNLIHETFSTNISNQSLKPISPLTPDIDEDEFGSYIIYPSKLYTEEEIAEIEELKIQEQQELEQLQEQQQNEEEEDNSPKSIRGYTYNNTIEEEVNTKIKTQLEKLIIEITIDEIDLSEKIWIPILNYQSYLSAAESYKRYDKNYYNEIEIIGTAKKSNNEYIPTVINGLKIKNNIDLNDSFCGFFSNVFRGSSRPLTFTFKNLIIQNSYLTSTKYSNCGLLVGGRAWCKFNLENIQFLNNMLLGKSNIGLITGLIDDEMANNHNAISCKAFNIITENNKIFYTGNGINDYAEYHIFDYYGFFSAKDTYYLGYIVKENDSETEIYESLSNISIEDLQNENKYFIDILELNQETSKLETYTGKQTFIDFEKLYAAGIEFLRNSLSEEELATITRENYIEYLPASDIDIVMVADSLSGNQKCWLKF